MSITPVFGRRSAHSEVSLVKSLKSMDNKLEGLSVGGHHLKTEADVILYRPVSGFILLWRFEVKRIEGWVLKLKGHEEGQFQRYLELEKRGLKTYYTLHHDGGNGPDKQEWATGLTCRKRFFSLDWIQRNGLRLIFHEGLTITDFYNTVIKRHVDAIEQATKVKPPT